MWLLPRTKAVRNTAPHLCHAPPLVQLRRQLTSSQADAGTVAQLQAELESLRRELEATQARLGAANRTAQDTGAELRRKLGEGQHSVLPALPRTLPDSRRHRVLLQIVPMQLAAGPSLAPIRQSTSVRHWRAN